MKITTSCVSEGTPGFVSKGRARLLPRMKIVACILLAGSMMAIAGLDHCVSQTANKLIVVVGAGGEKKYATQFKAWAGRWVSAGKQAGTQTILIDQAQGQKTSLQQLKDVLSQNDSSKDNSENESSTIWLVLIGHGTFDGTTARFNLPGPDLTAKELARLLNACGSKSIVINCASASGPFVNELVASERVIVTATRSGSEYNFARFGDYLSQAVADSAENSTRHDLDKDGQTSLLELVLAASRQTAEFYKTEQRLASEHALIEDNRDGLGTPADWFRGVRPVKRAKSGAAPDGLRSNQLFLVLDPNQPSLPAKETQARDGLEQQLEQLRLRKSEFPEDEYYQQLESILLKLAALYHRD